MANIFQNNINKYLKDAARPAKFEIYMTPPEDISLDISMNSSSTSNAKLKDAELSRAIPYFCYAASFPGITSEAIEYKYKGKTIPIPGVSTPNQTWSATFYNDEKHGIRKFFKNWIERSSPHNYNDSQAKIYNQTGLTIYQYDYELKNKTTGCQLIGVFPTNLGDLEISYENLSQIESFQVEFRYAYFEYFDIEGGLSADAVKDQIKGIANNAVNSVTQGAMNFAEGLMTQWIGTSFSEWSSNKVNELMKL